MKRRPPRHLRPKGWTGPTMPAPSPPVADIGPETRRALRAVIDQRWGDANYALSPLNREIMRRRFRVAMNEALGRPVV